MISTIYFATYSVQPAHWFYVHLRGRASGRGGGRQLWAVSCRQREVGRCWGYRGRRRNGCFSKPGMWDSGMLWKHWQGGREREEKERKQTGKGERNIFSKAMKIDCVWLEEDPERLTELERAIWLCDSANSAACITFCVWVRVCVCVCVHVCVCVCVWRMSE